MGFHSDSESQQFGSELAITHDNADISFGSEIRTSLPGKHHIVLCEKRGVKKNNLFMIFFFLRQSQGLTYPGIVSN